MRDGSASGVGLAPGAVDPSSPGSGGEGTHVEHDEAVGVPILPPGKMYIVPHPHSGKQPYIVDSPFPFSTAREEVPRRDLTPPAASSSASTTPQAELEAIHPFISMKDLEQAEEFIDFDQSDAYIDRQLRIDPRDGYKNARELHDYILRQSLDYNEFGEVRSYF